MINIEGKYTNAVIYNDNVETGTIEQVTDLCNDWCSEGSVVRIMSDAHEGNACVIGTTMTIVDRIVPNLVGVDVSCGMLYAQIEDNEIDFEKLDRVIRERVPSGFNSRNKAHEIASNIDLNSLRCADHINKLDRSYLQIGTLGGGNHFIELDRDSKGNMSVVIHSGSRNLGKQVAEYYQKLAIKERKLEREWNRSLIVAKWLEVDKTKINEELSKIPLPNDEFAYLVGNSFDDYIHDMRILQIYANLNRKAILAEICASMNFAVTEKFTTAHNYIDTENMILRKGAVSAQKGERLIIPMNMRDGSIIAIGKGSPDWNYSAPHGAGRIMGRKAAKKTFKLEDFQESMKGIYTTSVSANTIDESPFVYKPMQEIIDNIGDTVDIIDVIKPVYNYKDDGR